MSIATLGVAIVNYNTPADTRRCVLSILDYAIANPEDIVIVDNASPDGSGSELEQEFPLCQVELSPVNGGYAYAVNLAARRLSHEYLLVLNPDTEFVDRSLVNALRFMTEQKQIGLLGLNLIYPDGTQQYSARRFYSLISLLCRRTPLGSFEFGRRVTQEHLMTDKWTGQLVYADWVMGTGMLIRRTAFEAVSGMDEGFFLYLEDTDLCARLWRAGWHVAVFPEAKLVHHHRRESANGLFTKASQRHLRSFLRYIRHHGIAIFGHGLVQSSDWQRLTRQ